MKIEYADRGQTRYRPGVCNIGPAEIARRRRSGIIGVAVAVILAVALVVLHVPPLARVIVLLPLAGAIVSLEQARRHFCAGFAMAGIRNFGGAADRETVTEQADNAADRRSAWIMVSYSTVIAAVITGVFIALPL